MKYFVAILSLGVLGLIGGALFYGTKTIHDLLGENKQLKEAISNLTTEEIIGYAKVIEQVPSGDGVRTTVKFAEIDRDHQTVLLEKEVTVDGDIVFFDGLVVVFPAKMVMDGEERALHLWRRIFGENMKPSEGFALEEAGQEPARYREFFKKLGTQDKKVFWEAMWDLSNNPKALQKHGVRTIYGDAISMQMKPGLIYTFKLNNTGQVTVDTGPAI